jgi:hypothetical protein
MPKNEIIRHGANFLPNFAPDKSGVMPPELVKSAMGINKNLLK